MAGIRMTEGSIPKHLLRFGLPLLLSNMFQLTYNAVDSMILGRMVGMEALAASGTAGPLMNLLVLAISGLCIGAGVIMSEFYGAGDMKGLRQELAVLLKTGGGSAVIIALAAEILLTQIMGWLKVPGELYGPAGIYLAWILPGIPATFACNALAACIKSMGNAMVPLITLAAGSVVNILMDLLFVNMGLGIQGAAMATLISQYLTAALLGAYLLLRLPQARPAGDDWKTNRALLSRTLRDGGITALQQACQPVGKLMIQGGVNGLGVNAMAAFNAVTRMDDYACLPEQNLSSSVTTFLAQNRGAGHRERVKGGFLTGLVMEAVYGLGIGLVVFIARDWLMSLFVDPARTEVMDMGREYLLYMSLFYFLPAMTNLCQGFFRGMGMMKVTLAATITQISIRVLVVLLGISGLGLRAVAFGSAAGWLVMLAWEVPLLVHTMRRYTRA